MSMKSGHCLVHDCNHCTFPQCLCVCHERDKVS